jgi:short-subunit dehydrogenase
VERLAGRGARVVTCARDADRLGEVDFPDGVHVVAADLTVRGERAALVDAVLERHGRIDALVNNAGQGRVGLLTDLDADDVEEVVAVNLVAVADLTRLVLSRLGGDGAGEGDVVMISSGAAWVPLPPLSLYSATKAGVDGLVTALRREVARGVRIHSVNPGPVDTEWLARSVGLRPGEGPKALSGGVPASWVAAAVEKCLTASASRTLAVPRGLGVTRLTALPPFDRAINAVLAPLAPAIVRLGRRHRDRVADRS